MLTDNSVLAPAQLDLVPFPALAVVLVPPEVEMVEDSHPVEVLLADHVPLLATSAEVPTTSLEIVCFSLGSCLSFTDT